MSTRRIGLVAAILAVAVWLTCRTQPLVLAQVADRPREPLVDAVKQAIERGVQFLRDQEKGQGHWEHIPDLAFNFPMKG
ncbi:MAG: hypothetical protein AB7K24_33675, partial [Gemmataceae bacterium]